MDRAQMLVTVIGAGGGGAVLLALVNGFIKWLSGASGRERARNTDLLSQKTHAVEERIKAEQERDEADDLRRIAIEYAHSLRWLMKERGHEPPPLPYRLQNQREREV